jgi:hypothetical protein
VTVYLWLERQHVVVDADDVWHAAEDGPGDDAFGAVSPHHFHADEVHERAADVLRVLLGDETGGLNESTTRPGQGK